MTQIFISYSRTDRAVAQQLAARLEEAGYDVWWDVEITGGQRFEDEIQTALRAAAAVLILWSRASTASDWVRAEAEVARVARTAVPILIDDVSLDGVPLVFRALHTIDLRNWTGDTAAEGFRDVLGAVAKLAGAAGPSRAAPPSHYPQPTPPKPRARRWRIFAVLVVLLIAISAGARGGSSGRRPRVAPPAAASLHLTCR